MNLGPDIDSRQVYHFIKQLPIKIDNWKLIVKMARPYILSISVKSLLFLIFMLTFIKYIVQSGSLQWLSMPGTIHKLYLANNLFKHQILHTHKELQTVYSEPLLNYDSSQSCSWMAECGQIRERFGSVWTQSGLHILKHAESIHVSVSILEINIESSGPIYVFGYITENSITCVITQRSKVI